MSEQLRPAALRAPVFRPGELSGLKGLAAVWTDGKDIHVEANKSQVQSRESAVQEAVGGEGHSRIGAVCPVQRRAVRTPLTYQNRSGSEGLTLLHSR